MIAAPPALRDDVASAVFRRSMITPVCVFPGEKFMVDLGWQVGNRLSGMVPFAQDADAPRIGGPTRPLPVGSQGRGEWCRLLRDTPSSAIHRVNGLSLTT